MSYSAHRGLSHWVAARNVTCGSGRAVVCGCQDGPGFGAATAEKVPLSVTREPGRPSGAACNSHPNASGIVYPELGGFNTEFARGFCGLWLPASVARSPAGEPSSFGAAAARPARYVTLETAALVPLLPIFLPCTCVVLTKQNLPYSYMLGSNGIEWV